MTLHWLPLKIIDMQKEGKNALFFNTLSYLNAQEH